MSLEGQRLGQYRLLRLLGRGGMGEVYLAEDARIAQNVAIKVIRNEGIAYPESESAKATARLFEREAKAIARLDHPNILPLYAYGEETLQETPLTYLVMPYRKEGTLVDWLRRRGKAVLTPAEVAPLVQQAAEALQHAHNQQIIHQDIKPSNFLVRLREEQPNHIDLLLADFGIAKLASATASASQSVRGTPIYMAPEQWDGYPVPATDQYALAIMVYELLTGRPPFQGGLSQVMRQHFVTSASAPSVLNPLLPSAIDAVLLRALSKQPEQRFPSIIAFAQAFQQAAQNSGEIRATLAISLDEVQAGTMRQLTLPGGRLVKVNIPAGINDGTTLRLEGLGMPYYQGGPTGPLMLTISTMAADFSLSPQQESTEPTIAGLSSYLQKSSIENVQAPTTRPNTPPVPQPSMPVFPTRDNTPIRAVPVANIPLPPTQITAPSVYNPSLPTEVSPVSAPLPLQPDSLGTKGDAKLSNLRRFALLGLAVLEIATLISGIAWFVLHQAGNVTEFALPASYGDPLAITAGPDGNLWFTEYTGNKIGRITPSGIITEFPSPTPNSNLREIHTGPDGNLWFTEQSGNKIGRITPSGTITEFRFPISDRSPVGITTGPDGNLWFTEYSGNKIGRITPSGTITEFALPTSKSGPNKISTGPDGNLWFTEHAGNKIGRMTTDGIITEFALPTSNSHPLGIITGSDGNLWFTEQSGNKVGRITPNGTITEFLPPTSGSNPTGITMGADGNVWFTEQTSNEIGRISPGGIITEFPIPTPNSHPAGISAGPDGNLWFTERNGNKIGRITAGK
jgi:serine/threonine protein kinase/streptogramin lyase